MDSYTIINSVEKYKMNINDNKEKTATTTTTTTTTAATTATAATVTTTTATTATKESKVNKLTEMNMSSILYTNEQYKKKMNKSTKDITYETFKSSTDFDNFIDEDILNSKKKLSWKTMPIKWKIDLCKTYINNDESLEDNIKHSYLEKLSQKSDILDNVKYNKPSGTVTHIDYNLF